MSYQQAQYQQPYQPQAYEQQPDQRGPRVSTGVLVGVSLWRAAIVACALIGFFAAMSRGKFSSLIPALSQQASLLAGIVYFGLMLYPVFTGGRRHEPRSPWWRGAMVILLVLVCITYIAIIGGRLNSTWSMFEHLITPIAVLVDFFAVGRNQVAVKWWHPITWLVFPLAYLIYYTSAKLRIYGSFLNPSKSSFPGVIAGFIGALLALGFLLYAFGKIKKSIASQSRAAAWPLQYHDQAYAQAYPQQAYSHDPYAQQQAVQQPYPQQVPQQVPQSGAQPQGPAQPYSQPFPAQPQQMPPPGYYPNR